MGQKRDYEFERFSLGKLEFAPHPFEKGLTYEASLIPEINEDNENSARLTMNFKLSNRENGSCMFYIEDTAYFTISDEFGDFDVRNKKVQEMIDIVTKDIVKLVYDISSKAFDQPISLNINAQSFIEQMENN
ncbi:hypothetical protein KV134_08530 [Tetragenococcus halophilus]|nr:hypothetical protein [Tetragenococcus halophilus]MCO7027051.1 hypothetical protein [Tetragenococcus halophilus]NRR75039.1 hypothetical protein [Tetragenococcus halophilus]NWO00900.1 hypothetical protein [Tetragenococcus halophilus]QXN86253.1 hypothetical protein KV134_08530 [Tetragenococcus halophilus]RQD29197.1 hypothetical protein C7K42_09920 [Tetragenococcus halophilus subsp. halophilus DSM 20339]